MADPMDESAVGLYRAPVASSPIAQERVAPGRPGWGFLAALTGLAGVAGMVSLYAALATPEQLPAEAAWQDHVGGMADVLGLAEARVASAAGAALAVAGIALAARRLLHSDAAALFAGALVALDPALLAAGRSAVPDALVFAFLAWSFYLFLTPSANVHWLGGLAVACASFLDPRMLVWAIPMAFIVLARGHIYAAPQHLALTLAQAALLPILGALLHLLVSGSVSPGPECAVVSPWRALTLQDTVLYGPNVAAIHNPATWLAGAGALVFLAGGGLGVVLSRFRVARIPGRIQMRLVSPMHPTLGRAIWLVFLAIFAPTPFLWLGIFAIALAAGVREMSEDAPSFGSAVGLVLVAFAGLALARAWSAVVGQGDAQALADSLSLVPWTAGVGC